LCFKGAELKPSKWGFWRQSGEWNCRSRKPGTTFCLPPVDALLNIFGMFAIPPLRARIPGLLAPGSDPSSSRIRLGWGGYSLGRSIAAARSLVRVVASTRPSAAAHGPTCLRKVEGVLGGGRWKWKLEVVAKVAEGSSLWRRVFSDFCHSVPSPANATPSNSLSAHVFLYTIRHLCILLVHAGTQRLYLPAWTLRARSVVIISGRLIEWSRLHE
jgi:hypothetical protein